MDKQKFDALTRAFATGTSRRTAIKGIFGGAAAVAVASTRIGGAGAQGTPCTPATVLDDCVLPDECSTATCEQGVGTEAFFCTYSSDCDANCCPGGYCAECCDASDCEGSCDICDSGVCVSSCNDCQECEGGICADLDDGVCCDGTWVPGGQCCSTGDCLDTAATFCSSVTCSNYLCTVVPECPDDQQCCGYGQEGAYCAECCENSDCYIAGPCSVCEQGFCSTPTCCYDTDCPDCQVCGENGECAYLICELGETCCDGHECVPEADCCKGPGDWCGVLTADSDQLDCCDGLVCCENWNSQGSVCAQCCNDWDCGKDGWCHEGWCEYPTYCDHDKDCPKGTCCCNDGSCSGKCCHHPHPPKPPKPPAPTPPAPAPVTSLPATGAGPNDERNGLFGAAALGAAAAFVAAKKLRETSGEASTQE